jgi:hypothetical protein
LAWIWTGGTISQKRLTKKLEKFNSEVYIQHFFEMKKEKQTLVLRRSASLSIF